MGTPPPDINQLVSALATTLARSDHTLVAQPTSQYHLRYPPQAYLAYGHYQQQSPLQFPQAQHMVEADGQEFGPHDDTGHVIDSSQHYLAPATARQELLQERAESTSDSRVYPPALASHEEVCHDPNLFLETLRRMHEHFGTKLRIPTVCGQSLDLWTLYRRVTSLGGVQAVINEKKWNEVCSPFNFPTSFTSKSFTIRLMYTKLLHDYEQVYFFRNKGRVLAPPVDGGAEPQKRKRAEGSSPSHAAAPLMVSDVPSSPAGPSLSEIGASVSGNVVAQLDCGYFVKVTVSGREFQGVLYSLKKSSPEQRPPEVAISPETDSPKATAAQQPSAKKPKTGSKDVHRPKQNKTCFNYYSIWARAKAKENFPEADTKEISKVVGEMWARATPEEKAPFVEQAQKDRDRYERELSEFNSRKLQEGGTSGAAGTPLRTESPPPRARHADKGQGRSAVREEGHSKRAEGSAAPQASLGMPNGSSLSAGDRRPSLPKHGTPPSKAYPDTDVPHGQPKLLSPKPAASVAFETSGDELATSSYLTDPSLEDQARYSAMHGYPDMGQAQLYSNSVGRYDHIKYEEVPHAGNRGVGEQQKRGQSYGPATQVISSVGNRPLSQNDLAHLAQQLYPGTAVRALGVVAEPAAAYDYAPQIAPTLVRAATGEQGGDNVYSPTKSADMDYARADYRDTEQVSQTILAARQYAGGLGSMSMTGALSQPYSGSGEGPDGVGGQYMHHGRMAVEERVVSYEQASPRGHSDRAEQAVEPRRHEGGAIVAADANMGPTDARGQLQQPSQDVPENAHGQAQEPHD